MAVIWKYEFAVGDRVSIEMPIGAKVLKVENQNSIPCMWVLVGQAEHKAERQFRVFGTGHHIPDGLTHIATFQDGDFVWHVFEKST